MKHIIDIFDADTEEHVESIDIPVYRKKALSTLVGWHEPEDEMYCYDLSAQQLIVIEEWAGRKIGAPDRIAQLAGLAD